MKLTCQIILTALLTVGFFATLHRDVNGRKSLEPSGFSGIVATIVVNALVILMFWKAGLFSELIP